jgi:L,D-peptidoglycan transpeptidase YkuD (ErfK/YbiS/YcfS/YnhG family)
MNIVVYADGYLQAGDKVYRATYGHNGIGKKHREGDGISPEGVWPLRRAFYRSDRMEKPETGLPIDVLKPNYAWSDVESDPQYNQLVMLPNPVIEEHLWREDGLYDLFVVIGYNDDPIIVGKGSGILLHVARPEFSPSAGCACVSLPDLLEIAPHLDRDSTLEFTSKTLKGEAVKWPYKAPMD